MCTVLPWASTQRSYSHAALIYKTQRESMRVTALGFRLRVIVNEKSLNLEKTTSSAQSVLLLIYVQKEIEILGFFE